MRKGYQFRPEFTRPGSLSKLEVLGRFAVAPGETISGAMTISLVGDTMVKPVLNSMIADIYAFYVPHRVASDEWVPFITDPDSNSLTLTTTPAPEFFESTVMNRNLLFREAYTAVWNEYFRDEDIPELSVVNGAQRIRLYPDLEKSLTTDLASHKTTMDVSSGTLDVTELRRKMRSDRQGQRLAIYGDKYLDLLMHQGVKPPAGLIDRPEVLVHDRHRVRVNLVYDTSSVDLGKPTGVFRETWQAKLPRRYCAEHGYVMVLLGVRPRAVNVNNGGDFESIKTGVEVFYLKDLAGKPYGSVGDVWVDGTSGTAKYGLPQYEDYRRGLDMVDTRGAWAWTYDPGVAPSKYDLAYPPSTAWDSYFRGDVGTDSHYMASARLKVDRLSPVPARSV